MNPKTAALAGATGLVGSQLLQGLLDDPAYGTVRVLVRHPFALQHPKLQVRLVDFADADSLLLALDGSDVVFCAVGTTQKKVRGDQAAYRRVDYEIPLRLARLCREVGAPCFVLVSAMGANPRSRNFYLRLKGETEEAIRGQGPAQIHILRPSVLLGRRAERRPLERLSQGLLRILGPLLPAGYRAIRARDVARAMQAAAAREQPGFHIYTYREMKELTA
ncbi:MAG TPA: NAD(P)H-binding protein [Chitinophagaceae bacterium]|nr:NAD(P)H-binding protein [Chitinophagaceae bacterium]